MPDTTLNDNEIPDNLDEEISDIETTELSPEIDNNNRIESEPEITSVKSVSKSKKTAKKDKKEKKKPEKKSKTKKTATIDIDVEKTVAELAEIERLRLVKEELARQVKNEKAREGKRLGAQATNAIRDETKRKSILFDKYLAGDLTRDDCLLQGFVPQERKVVRKDPNNETISELRRRLFDF